MAKQRKATLVFLIKRSHGEITDICLAMKKRGFGVNRWNGVGGKVKELVESIEEAAIRETKEEINVTVVEMSKVAELSFYFPHHSDWDQVVHVYWTKNWKGEPSESEEMRPKWFAIDELPYKTMWPDDIYWLPEVVKGRLLKARFVFGENDFIQDKEIKIVKQL